MRIAPRQFFFLIAFAFFLIAAGMITLSLQMPRLGYEFDRAQPADAPLRVLSVATEGAADRALKAGDVISAYIASDGQAVPLRSELLLTYPGKLLTYTEYNRYIADLDRLYQASKSGVLHFVLADGRRADVSVTRSYDIYEMPGWWGFRIFRTALIIFLVTGPLAFQRKNAAVRSFALAGIASAATGFALLPLEGRELLISGWLMHHLYLSIWASELIYGGALLALLWTCPVKLPGHQLVWLIPPLFACLWWANTFQMGASMADMQAIPSIIAFGFGLMLLCLQWRATISGTPQRRTVLWFIVFINGGIAWFISLLIVPLLLHQQPTADVQLITLSSLFVFVGLSLGMYRDRLFSIDPWMVSAWLLFAATFVVWACDLLLVWVLKVDSLLSLAISMIVVVGIYLPIRHWLWMFLRARKRQETHQLILRLIDVSMRYDTASTSAERWQSWLKDVFQPLHMEIITLDESVSGTAFVKEAGAVLHVAALGELPAMKLQYADVGDQFFTERDARLCELMMRWFMRARDMQESRKHGEQAERSRMMRDLHDDIVPPLLSLIYQTQGSSLNSRIRELMNNLRKIILELDQPELSTKSVRPKVSQ